MKELFEVLIIFLGVAVAIEWPMRMNKRKKEKQYNHYKQTRIKK